MEDRLTKGNRALSALICKCRDFDPQFLLFSKLYDTLVTTVIDYGAEVWGTRAVDRSVDRVQNRAIRGFLGVGIHHPITALETECGWIPTRWRVRLKVLMYWRKLLIMPDTIVIKKIINHILAWDIKVGWILKINDIFEKLKLGNPLDCKSLSGNEFKSVICSCLTRELKKEWNDSMNGSSKLRDLASLMDSEEPSYSTEIRNREVRSLIAKLRGGTARLRIEEGRWLQIEREDRICQNCNLIEVEDCAHFIFRCGKPSLRNVRASLLEELKVDNSFDSKMHEEKLLVVLREACKSKRIGSLLLTMWKKRTYPGN